LQETSKIVQNDLFCVGIAHHARSELTTPPNPHCRLWIGATTIAAGDGSRQPSGNELAGAIFQGKHVAEIAAKFLVDKGIERKAEY
jgi:hypothetical protein